MTTPDLTMTGDERRAAVSFLLEALGNIDSRSVCDWVRSEHNYPIFVKMAANALAKNPDACPMRFATYTVCLKIGA